MPIDLVSTHACSLMSRRPGFGVPRAPLRCFNPRLLVDEQATAITRASRHRERFNPRLLVDEQATIGHDPCRDVQVFQPTPAR